MTDDKKPTCCREFDPSTMDEKEISLDGKLFLKSRYACIFHIPINMGSAMKKACKIAADSGSMPENALWLCDENSPWGADLYIEVAKDIPGANIAKLDGKYLAKVFDGEYREMPQWIAKMKAYVAEKGQKTDKILVYYTTCPKCSKLYGHNYVCLMAKIG